jgi:alpha-galactosidase
MERHFEDIAELTVDPATARIYAEGWQSWSPSLTYRLDQPTYRPTSKRSPIASYAAEWSAPEGVYQGAGLAAIQAGADAPVHVFGVASTDDPEVPLIRAIQSGNQLRVTASSPTVEEHVEVSGADLDTALARWADDFALRAGAPPMRRAPTVWCTWYQYFTSVTEADVDENLEQVDRLDLPVEVIQIDDGWQREIGDWLPPTRFESLPALFARIHSRGRRAGVWLAPFLVGARSDVAAMHPDWLVRGDGGQPIDAGFNWGQDLFALDLAHPGVRDHLDAVFRMLRDWGADYFKIDFLYAGALPGRRARDATPLAAYRDALKLIRSAIGDSYLLGCGAPLLPSVGLVDAMRVSPDTAPVWANAAESAAVTGAGRAWQQGRFWINDPDCLIVRPEVERREEWAAHVERYGGLRASSDRLLDLDGWGLETTRRILSVSPVKPFVASAAPEWDDRPGHSIERRGS